MADEAPRESTAGVEAPAEAGGPAVVRPKHHRRRWPWVLAGIVLSPILLFAIYTAIALHYTYSSGRRAGYVQKFSKKGWLCKTWEGELAMVNVPGAMQEKWEFTVRSDSIANILLRDMASQVALTYDQHKGIPTSCFGETEYFVTGVEKVHQ